MTKRNTLLNDNGKGIETAYREWLRKAARGPVSDPDVLEELKEIREDREKIADAFYRNLTFGTGGA